jgi:hypothetical protein
MSVVDDLITHLTKERADLWQLAELLHSGKLHTGERTRDHPQWADTTKASLERALRQLGEFDAILLRLARPSQ